MGTETSIASLGHVSYRWRGRVSFGLEIADFYLAPAETVLLLGESGSGKSTLLSLICGTITADQGTVHVAGTDIASLSPGARDRFRAERIGLIFQQFNLLPYASVLDNILLPLRFAPQRRARVDDPPEAARALIGAPPLIVADEPTSALDAATQAVFLELLFAQVRASGSTLLMVSHDARLAPHFDRVALMSEIAKVPA